MFLKNGEIPDVWKMDMSQILDTSSSEEDEKQSEEDDEEEEEKKKRIREEVSDGVCCSQSGAACCLDGLCEDVMVSVPQPEEEADPEERDNFLQQLYKFMEDRGESAKVPMIPPLQIS